MSVFEFVTAPRIIFGSGSIQQIGPIAAANGKIALVVTGKNSLRAAYLIQILQSHHVQVFTFNIPAEPTVDEVVEGVKYSRELKVDLVVGFGGGSPIDAAKAIASLVANPGTIFDYLEVIGHGKFLEKPSLPFIAIPTTSGTGTEVTKNAVISSKKDKVKVSLRHQSLIPQIALLDPELTFSCPPSVTAYAGMDALTQLIEPYTSPKANPITDVLCIDGITRIASSLRTAYEDGSQIKAREDLMLASLYGGIALTNAGLGAVHGLSGVIGGMSNAPHGAICARLLPFVMEENLKSLLSNQPDHPVIRRFLNIASLLTGSASAVSFDSVGWIRELITVLHIPPLSVYPISKNDFPQIIQQSKKASSMRNNIVVLSDDEIFNILEQAY